MWSGWRTLHCVMMEVRTDQAAKIGVSIPINAMPWVSNGLSDFIGMVFKS